MSKVREQSRDGVRRHRDFFKAPNSCLESLATMSSVTGLCEGTFPAGGTREASRLSETSRTVLRTDIFRVAHDIEKT